MEGQRVNGKLTIKQLRSECEARQEELSSYKKASKNELLELLVDGTTLLSESTVYKDLLKLKEQIKDEKLRNEKTSQALSEARRQKNEIQAYKRKVKIEDNKAKIREAEQKLVEERRIQRIKENEKFYTITCPTLLHECNLAKASDVGRSYTGNCDVKEFNCRGGASYSCEKCNFDVCLSCFNFASLPVEEQKRQQCAFQEKVNKEREKRKMAFQEEVRQTKIRLEKIEEQRQAQLKEEQKERKKLIQRLNNPTLRMKNPNKENIDQEKCLSYVVWSSDGYDYDGWHSYDGPPTKEFDSSFKTLNEARKRAEYLFYVNNPWGISLDEMIEEHDVDVSFDEDDLIHLEVCPPDSTRWTVAVSRREDFKDSDDEDESFDKNHK